MRNGNAITILEELDGYLWIAYNDQENCSWEAFVIPKGTSSGGNYSYERLGEIAKETYEYRKKLDDERLQRFEVFKKNLADRKKVPNGEIQ